MRRADLLVPGTRIWIAADGSVHALTRSHGGAFLAVKEKVSRSSAHDGAMWNWMFANCGSVPPDEDIEPEEWDSEDNPGWQFNEFAIRSLGWVLASVSTTQAGLEIAARYDRDAVTSGGLASLEGLITTARRLREPVTVCFDALPAMTLAEAIECLLQDRGDREETTRTAMTAPTLQT